MVNPCGAEHCCNVHDPLYTTMEQIKELIPLGILEPFPIDDMGPRKAALLRLVQLKQIVNDCLVICMFIPYSYQQLADIAAAVTGWDTGIMEQMRIAERILTMARLFNIREGFTAADDVLPRRFYQPKTDRVLANEPLDPAKLEKAKSYYYTLMGWDARTGVPLPEKLEELDIAWTKDYLTA